MRNRNKALIGGGLLGAGLAATPYGRAMAKAGYRGARSALRGVGRKRWQGYARRTAKDRFGRFAKALKAQHRREVKRFESKRQSHLKSLRDPSGLGAAAEQARRRLGPGLYHEGDIYDTAVKLYSPNQARGRDGRWVSRSGGGRSKKGLIAAGLGGAGLLGVALSPYGRAAHRAGLAAARRAQTFGLTRGTRAARATVGAGNLARRVRAYGGAAGGVLGAPFMSAAARVRRRFENFGDISGLGAAARQARRGLGMRLHEGGTYATVLQLVEGADGRIYAVPARG